MQVSSGSVGAGSETCNGQAVIKRVALVKLGVNNGSGDGGSCFGIEVWTATAMEPRAASDVIASSDDGSRPSRGEALIIAVTYGSSTSTISFSRNVGMGSSAHDFVGDAVINRRTSSSLHRRSVDSSTSAVELNTVSGSLAVPARADFTFSSK